MSEIPIVPWRFNEKYLVTDFVMAKNVAIREQAAALFGSGKEDAFIENVASWIRDSFFYPLDNSGNPSASGQLLRHQKGALAGYHFKNCVYYCWSLPNEVMMIGAGICIDTANLTGSILRAKEINNAWVCIGDVKSVKDDTLLGRHAWVEVAYHGTSYVLETTVHEEGANNLVEAVLVYDKESLWAKKAGLYYLVQGKYDEREFVGEGPLGAQAVELMGFPAGMMQHYGLESTRRRGPSKLAREWKREELRKDRLVREAYRG